MVLPFTQHQADSLRSLLLKSKPDTNRVVFLVQIGQFYVAKKWNNKIDLDSAYLFYRQALALTRKLGFKKGEIRSMYLLGTIYAESSEVVKSRSVHSKAVKMCQAWRYIALEAEGWYHLAQVFDAYTNTIPALMKYYERSMDLYARAGYIQNQAYILKTIADLNYLQGNSELALKQLLECQRLYQSINYPRLHHTYNLLSAVNRAMGNYEHALKYGLAAVERSHATKDTADIVYFYLQLGWIYENLKQHEVAIRYNKEALLKVQAVRDTRVVLQIAKSIGLSYLELNRPIEAIAFFKKVLKEFPPKDECDVAEIAAMLSRFYIYKKNYASAEKYLLQILEYERKTPNVAPYKIDLYQQIVDFYIEMGNYGKAREHLAHVLEWNKRNGVPVLSANVRLHHSMFKIDSAQGNYKSAINHYQQYKMLNDSIFDATKSNQIASIQIQYDTKKKEQDNALLRKTNQAQQASIRQKDFQRNATFIGTILMGLLLALSYNQYRVKKRSNDKLQAKQNEISKKNIRQQRLLEEKEWLLKEIHHRVKNNLQTVMSLLESQSAYLKNDALTAIKDSQHRVQAMSLIHQKLYLTENVTTINMQAYIREVVSYLQDSFDTRQRIRFQFSLKDIDLDITQAIPIGLILNEAITNAIKYAFPDGREGIIRVSIRGPSDGFFELSINDNGVGLPIDFEDHKMNSLGIRLMHGLSNEVGGQLNMVSKEGTSVSVLFEIEKVFRRATNIEVEEIFLEYEN